MWLLSFALEIRSTCYQVKLFEKIKWKNMWKFPQEHVLDTIFGLLSCEILDFSLKSLNIVS